MDRYDLFCILQDVVQRCFDQASQEGTWMEDIRPQQERFLTGFTDGLILETGTSHQTTKAIHTPWGKWRFAGWTYGPHDGSRTGYSLSGVELEYFGTDRQQGVNLWGVRSVDGVSMPDYRIFTEPNFTREDIPIVDPSIFLDEESIRNWTGLNMEWEQFLTTWIESQNPNTLERG